MKNAIVAGIIPQGDAEVVGLLLKIQVIEVFALVKLSGGLLA
jgi:hypothetical protein